MNNSQKKVKLVFQVVALIAIALTLIIMLFIPYHTHILIKEKVIEPRGSAQAIESILQARNELDNFSESGNSTFFAHATSNMGTSEMLISLAIMALVLTSTVVLVLGIITKKNGFHYFFFLPIGATILWPIINNSVSFYCWTVEHDGYLSGYGDYTSQITTTESAWMHFEVNLTLLIIASLAFTVVGIMSIKEERQKQREKSMQNLGTVISKSVTKPATSSVSTANELKQYKELLDMGAITQAEYEAKKKELLGG